MMQNNYSKRITAWVALVAAVFVMLFSRVYIAEHTDHSCSGDECPVCATMLQCSNNIKNVGTALIVVSTAVSMIALTSVCITTDADIVSICSLISQKVRLNI